MIELLLILISILMVVGCGIFVAAEFSFIAVNRNTVQKLAHQGDRKAQRVEQALKSLSTQLSGAQVGITITNLVIGFLAEPAIAALIAPSLNDIGVADNLVSPIALVLGIVIATIFTMIFGELVPKNLAIARSLATAKAVQGPHLLFTWIMREPIRVLNNSANFALRKMGIEPTEELASARTADELLSLVKRSAEKGTLPKETAQMVERSINFNDLTVIDVMTPRVQVEFVNDSSSLDDVLEASRRTGHSRFPIIGEDVDDVKGVIHIKQIMGIERTRRAQMRVSEIMKDAAFVPSSMHLEPLLESLRGSGAHLCVAIDEFGGVDGVITIEDLIEELVGEVHDEHDDSTRSIIKKGNNAWLLSGLLRPDEIGEELGLFLPDNEDYETLAGLFVQRLGRMARINDTIDVTAVDRAGQRITVRMRAAKLDERRLDRIKVSLIGTKEADL